MEQKLFSVCSDINNVQTLLETLLGSIWSNNFIKLELRYNTAAATVTKIAFCPDTRYLGPSNIIIRTLDTYKFWSFVQFFRQTLPALGELKSKGKNLCSN